MAQKAKDPFSKAAQRPLKDVGKSEASSLFEQIAEQRAIQKAAERLGTTPDAIIKEAEAKGVNVIDLIKDKPVAEKPKAEPKEKAKKASESVKRPELTEEEILKYQDKIKSKTYIDEALAKAFGEDLPAPAAVKKLPKAPPAPVKKAPAKKAEAAEKKPVVVKDGVKAETVKVAAPSKKPEPAKEPVAAKKVKAPAETNITKIKEQGPPVSQTSLVDKAVKETGVSKETLKSALEETKALAKSSGESMETVIKSVPDRRLKAALGLIAAGLVGFGTAQKVTSSKKESGWTPEKEKLYRELKAMEQE